jgi:hypothetical protein
LSWYGIYCIEHFAFRPSNFARVVSGRLYSGLGGRVVRRDQLFALAMSSGRVFGAFHAGPELQESQPNPAQLEPLAIWRWHAANRHGRHYQLDRSLAAIRSLPDSAVGQVNDFVADAHRLRERQFVHSYSCAFELKQRPSKFAGAFARSEPTCSG